MCTKEIQFGKVAVQEAALLIPKPPPTLVGQKPL